MHAAMIKFYRDAGPPKDRRDRVTIAAFGVGELEVEKLQNGEFRTPDAIPQDVELVEQMARLEIRLTGKLNYPYGVWFVLDYEGQKAERRVYRSASFAAAKDWVQVSGVGFIANMTASAGGQSLMTGYKYEGGVAKRQYDLLPEQAAEVRDAAAKDR